VRDVACGTPSNPYFARSGLYANVRYLPFSARCETAENDPNYSIVTASYHTPQTFGRKLSVNLYINVVNLHAHAIHGIDR
jgi:hypothetical protein